jgi:hypothetical protein
MNNKGHYRLNFSNFSTWELIKLITSLIVVVPLLLVEKATEILKNKMKRR